MFVIHTTQNKPYIENVCCPTEVVKHNGCFIPTQRWTIPTSDFLISLNQAIKQNDEIQLHHLLNDFWLCDEYMLLKSDIQGEVQ